jgi:putative ABC transport system ATP-binding protein
VIRSTALAFAYPHAAPLCFPDVAVPQGAVLLLHGASGSGKSTWLSLVAALVAPTAGSLEVAGQPLVGLSQSAADAWRARHLGFLPQKLHLSPALTVADNLALAYWAAGLALNRARIQTCLESLGIADLARRLPAQLSGGQAQRVALARAVLQQPQVLLADEPTASLDDAAAAAAVALLLATSCAHGATLVIATHDARVDTLLHCGFDAENGTQPAQVLRMQLSKIEQIAPPAQACGAGAAP